MTCPIRWCYVLQSNCKETDCYFVKSNALNILGCSYPQHAASVNVIAMCCTSIHVANLAVCNSEMGITCAAGADLSFPFCFHTIRGFFNAVCEAWIAMSYLIVLFIFPVLKFSPFYFRTTVSIEIFLFGIAKRFVYQGWHFDKFLPWRFLFVDVNQVKVCNWKNSVQKVFFFFFSARQCTLPYAAFYGKR